MESKGDHAIFRIWINQIILLGRRSWSIHGWTRRVMGRGNVRMTLKVWMWMKHQANVFVNTKVPIDALPWLSFRRLKTSTNSCEPHNRAITKEKWASRRSKQWSQNWNGREQSERKAKTGRWWKFEWRAESWQEHEKTGDEFWMLARGLIGRYVYVASRLCKRVPYGYPRGCTF